MAPQRLKVPLTYRLTLWMLLASTLLVSAMVARVVYPPSKVRIMSPMPIVSPLVIRAGDSIEFIIDYCSDSDVFGWVGGVFASTGKIYPLIGKWPATLPPGCHVVREVIATPQTLAPGSYKFYMAREYAPTVIATTQTHVETTPFTVID
jgi:hypothetical protein